MSKLTILVSVLMLFIASSYAQVSINKDGSSPNSNSILHVKGDATTKNIVLETGTNGGVGIGTDSPDYKLTIQSEDNNALRLIGTEGDYGHGAVLSFGDGHYAEIREEDDDCLTIFSSEQTAIMGKNVGIGTTNPEASAILDVSSSNKGFLPPRMTDAEIGDIASPANGLMVFNTTDNKVYVFVSIDNEWKEINYGAPFPCGDALIDARDSKSYTTVQIGTQCWMKENLNIGVMINSTSGGTDNDGEQTNNSIIEKYCYSNNTSNCDTYGGLYQWNEMMQYVTTAGTQGICPNGWHIPTDDEWKTMEMHLGMTQAQADDISLRGTDEGEKMKSTSGWYNNGNGTNSSGFTALPGGYRHGNGSFHYLGSNGYWWSSTEGSGSNAWNRNLYYDNDRVSRSNYSKAYGFSVRCLKN